MTLPARPDRFDRLDALRGLAMVWMTGFHLAFDLNQFHLIPRQHFYADPFWTLQRMAIVTLFLGCVGLSQAVAQAQQVESPRFWWRWARIAGGALLVSAGSALMFPRSWISFGVLHAVAVMLLIVRGLRGLRLPDWGWIALGVGVFAVASRVSHPLFDARWTNWLGLTTRKPITEDYVPLLPWFGAVAVAMGVGQWLLRSRPALLQGGLPAALQPLARLGRWSLPYYLLHQPVLIGLVMAWTYCAPNL
ncbi:heparan-alpha-glucosaminide N-acetyltransferase [Sphaerotilus sp.]|uniref:heparan-alpha-glucosaminide N-acetyltransferase n=1 Tax=Sphaerotilus sp. TaxID=2093942 RepID=UPI0025D80F63|nr:heparan-alpha-glucosaminide N-acetyltransferase [Sphaerotilus sp.]